MGDPVVIVSVHAKTDVDSLYTPTQTYSSASTPLNTTNIAVMKVSHVVVVMVGPELLFSIYKCCGFFLWGSSAKRLRAELTLAQCGSINGPAGLEVAPSSVFHGHDVIKVRNQTEVAG